MTSSADAPIQVDFVLELVPHYRAGVVRALESSDAVSPVWVTGQSVTRTAPIPTSREPIASHIPVTNTKYLSRFVWQKGVLWRALTTNSPLTVFTGDPQILSTWIAAASLRLRRKKVAFWTHGWRQPDSGTKRIVRLSFYKLADALFLYGDWAAELGRQAGYKKRMFVVGNSNDAPILSNRPARSRENEIQRWCIISRLIPERQIDMALQAMSILRDLNRTVILTVIGNGPELEKLQSDAHARGLNVIFLGAIYDEDKTAEILSNNDILVSPGNIGLAAIHALSSGCPVSTHSDRFTQMPEAASVIPGQTGVLFRRNDSKSLALETWEFVENMDTTQVMLACHTEIEHRWTASVQSRKLIEAVRSVAPLSEEK